MPKTYTVAEIAAHNTEESLWVIYGGNVLDMTDFRIEHPGGEDVLLEYAGGDIAEAFDDLGHSVDAFHIMAHHVIGVVAGSDLHQMIIACAVSMDMPPTASPTSCYPHQSYS